MRRIEIAIKYIYIIIVLIAYYAGLKFIFINIY